MRVLFVCNQKENRSKTAELLFKDSFETRSAGLFNESPVTREDLEWADVVVVMEDFQRSEIGKRFPSEYIRKKILSLDIPDVYHFNQPELVDVLKSRIGKLF